VNPANCSTTATGSENTAVGFNALFGDTTGSFNSAYGVQSLSGNQDGEANTSMGWYSMKEAVSAFGNTAIGAQTLQMNNGSYNSAVGHSALINATGSYNIAIGVSAGFSLGAGSSNIEIGNTGAAADANTIRIGTNAANPQAPVAGEQTRTFIAGIFNSGTPPAGALSVFVGSDGHLYGGPAPIIVPINVTSEEFHSLQRTVEEQKTIIDQQRTEFETRVAQQQKTLETLTAQLKQQNDQLQRVTVRMEQNRAKLQKVANRK
jgi:uncharacterized coiled-coil protein SlyX